jgi:hypothetical protein
MPSALPDDCVVVSVSCSLHKMSPLAKPASLRPTGAACARAGVTSAALLRGADWHDVHPLPPGHASLGQLSQYITMIDLWLMPAMVVNPHVSQRRFQSAMLAVLDIVPARQRWCRIGLYSVLVHHWQMRCMLSVTVTA